jgi:hypothetical protein
MEIGSDGHARVEERGLRIKLWKVRGPPTWMINIQSDDSHGIPLLCFALAGFIPTAGLTLLGRMVETLSNV